MLGLSDIPHIFSETWEEAFLVEPLDVYYGWHLEKNSNYPEIRLVRWEKGIILAATFFPPFNFNKGYRENSYCEGLWEGDVVELFYFRGDGTYLEFNLAPSGAWWLMEFSKYRERKKDFSVKDTVRKVYCSQFGVEENIRSVAYLPLSFFYCHEGGINVCAIVGRERKSYLTYCHIDSEVPDFHWFAK